jgi:hypothetical protein
MKAGIRISVLVVISPLIFAACGGSGSNSKSPVAENPNPPAAGTPSQLVVENHWGGNTGGRGSMSSGGDCISNFIVDFAVLNPSQTGHQEWAPLVITKSYWDETNWGDGGYSGGMRVTKGEFYYQPHADSGWPGITFDTTTYNGITATIAHPSALSAEQQNAEDQGGSLSNFSSNLPYVKLSDGRTITTVAYPTSVAFDGTGRLWVADNGKDQNFKIFDVSGLDAPTQIDTFGDEGGVFAVGTGKLKGQTGEKRFWGPRGVGFGDKGEIIVGTSGIPGQTQGGTDVRAFDSTGKFLWDVKAIFMHAPDIDPTSNGTQIYTAAQRFEMDYSKAPGKSWRQAAVTLDPFRFPGDPRLMNAYDIAFIRVVNNQRFLFVSDMYGYDLAVFRFEANSDIAIPAAFIGIGGSQQATPLKPVAPWTQGLAPVWIPTLDENKNRRLMWRDTDGDGAVDANQDAYPEAREFSDVQMPYMFSRGIDIDDNGNVWVAGKFNEHSSGSREGGNLMIPFGSIDDNGVPFSGSVPKFVDVPSTLISPEDQGKTSGRMRYLAATDTLLMATGEREDYYSSKIYIIDGYLNSSHPTLRFKLDLGYNDLGSAITDILQTDTTKMVLPNVFAADADYIYVGYIDNGPDAKVRGEITVYSMVDGHKVGWIVPGAETNHFAGNFDMKVGIQVRKLADGTRIITAEEDGGGKFMVYRWKP